MTRGWQCQVEFWGVSEGGNTGQLEADMDGGLGNYDDWVPSPGRESKTPVLKLTNLTRSQSCGTAQPAFLATLGYPGDWRNNQNAL
jgi:hypothetical protein